MNDESRTKVRADGQDRVIVVGAGPVGCTAALLLADYGVPVTLLERHTEPHPLPRAVHLDDEVARILGRVGVSDEFLARSRSCSGLRLLDAGHRVMAEFRREHETGVNGFPQANMFHQPDLEQLLLARVGQHPLIDFRRGVTVIGLNSAPGLIEREPVLVQARGEAGQAAEFPGRFVLGCDGANSTIREQLRISMEDLGFTERWLVVDIRAARPLDTWDGVEQVCDPARAATFMHVTGDRYRWEFQLRDSEQEADLITPPALGRLLQPWTGRADLAGLDIIRSATYTFRARLASRFQAGRVFLLGDAAHLTPPFIGQGLAAGLRDADNLAWKIAYALAGRAGDDLLASYEAERRPHARAMVKKAVLVGWAMTGGQDRAAVLRRIALAVVVRSARVCDAIISTVTPRLRAGAVRRPPRRIVRSGEKASAWVGGLLPNPEVTTGGGGPVRLDTVLRGRTAVLTAGAASEELLSLCRRNGLLLVRVRTRAPADGPPACADPAGDGWISVRIAGERPPGMMADLIRHPGLVVLVRPDGVLAAADSRGRLRRVPWSIPAGPGVAGRPLEPSSAEPCSPSAGT
jgi:3-(3-hydroxy-phenyl)propionate hydroxylase